MNRQTKFNLLFMNFASSWAEMSHCEKRKVGAVIVKNNRVLASGYNGTPPGCCNDCENANGDTLDVVRHAEVNALAWAKEHDIDVRGATLYCTLAPCFDCAQEIVWSGIKEVVFPEVSSKGAIGLPHLRAFSVKLTFFRNK